MALADAKTAFREALGSYVQLDRLDDEIADTFPASDPFTPDRENGQDAQPAGAPTAGIRSSRPSNPAQVTLEDGTNQQFKIPKNQKFNVDGQMVDAWGLKKGMKVSATKVVEEPVTVVEHQAQVTGSMPPPPPPPAPEQPILVAVAAPAPAPAAPPAELSKTGSMLPLIGLLGGLLLLSALGLRAIRSIY